MITDGSTFAATNIDRLIGGAADFSPGLRLRCFRGRGRLVQFDIAGASVDIRGRRPFNEAARRNLLAWSAISSSSAAASFSSSIRRARRRGAPNRGCDAASRRSRSEFVCTACGHADIVGARNIEQARILAVEPPKRIRRREALGCCAWHLTPDQGESQVEAEAQAPRFSEGASHKIAFPPSQRLSEWIQRNGYSNRDSA